MIRCPSCNAANKGRETCGACGAFLAAQPDERGQRVGDADLAATLALEVSKARVDVALLEAENASLRAALAKINTIRNSIIGLQTINWSEHIYPLVATLGDAGIEGMPYDEARGMFGTMLERTNAAEAALATAKRDGWIAGRDASAKACIYANGDLCRSEIEALTPPATEGGRDV